MVSAGVCLFPYGPDEAATPGRSPREMPSYQSVTVPLRQLNRVACLEAKEQDKSRRGGGVRESAMSHLYYCHGHRR
jgi:hypothetical protein